MTEEDKCECCRLGVRTCKKQRREKGAGEDDREADK